jgi:hypothetical protein
MDCISDNGLGRGIAQSGANTLFDKVYVGKSFHCSDPRDIIYSLFGLIEELQAAPTRVYSLPVERIYQVFTEFLYRGLMGPRS